MSGKTVVGIDGTIGVGKTTFGRILSERFGGTFLDGDDFKGKSGPWYCSSLTTCRNIRTASLTALDTNSIVFISRPIRCLDWVYFKHHFKRASVDFLSIGLQANSKNIANHDRGRAFSLSETRRMTEMIQQGYGARAYSQFHVRTDLHNIEDTSTLIEERLRRLIEANTSN